MQVNNRVAGGAGKRLSVEDLQVRTDCCCALTPCFTKQVLRKEEQRKDYTFQSHLNEKLSFMPGCPGKQVLTCFCLPDATTVLLDC